MKHFNFYTAAALIISFAVLGCGTLSGPEPDKAELTADGWDFFRNGYYRTALQSFEDALDIDFDYVPALLGKGWTHLMRSEYTEAEIALNTVESFTDTIVSMYVGRALRYMVSDADYGLAITDVTSALSLDSSFVFKYRNDIDFHDLYIMRAVANYRLGNLDLAQQDIDYLYGREGNATGLEPDEPATWIIAGVQFPTYAEALLRAIQEMVEIYGTGYFIG